MQLIYELLTPDAYAPTKSFPEDAGWDLRSRESVALLPGRVYRFMLGMALKLQPSPEQDAFAAQNGLSWYLRAADRSGLALAPGIHVLGGVVDRNYRGEVGIILMNLGFWDGNSVSFKSWVVNPGDRIAQVVPELIADCREAVPGIIGTSDRGGGGFGSTGTQ